MADDQKALASGIKNPHLTEFEALWRERLDGFDLQAILVYLVDTVPEDALVWLARQFSIMGNEGWAFATTTQQKRDLVKSAIELHKRKGTPYAIRNSMERVTAISYADVTIIEGDALTPIWTLDGTVFLSGDHFLGATAHWTEFAVVIDTGGTGTGFNANLYSLLLALIAEYKPVRSNLVELAMGVFFEDSTGAPVEELEFTTSVSLGTESLTFDLYLDGTFNLDGSMQLDTDHLTLTII